MLPFKILLLLNEGLIFGILALGVYVAFQWLRFPDLTPDGSFASGAALYVKASILGCPPIISLLAGLLAGALGGCLTATASKVIKIPSVVAGLIVSSALYSINWLILGKPNQFLDSQFTLSGSLVGVQAALTLFWWLLVICTVVVLVLRLFSTSIWGIKLRAIGENPLLANDLAISETKYTFIGLAIANGLVGLSGALFAQRSYSADINMGVGVTIVGLSGVILGLLFSRKRYSILVVLILIMLGSIANKAAIFLALEIGVPAESFRLMSATALAIIFLLVKSTDTNFLKEIRWN